MRGSQAVVGMNSGITIMSTIFGVKTIMVIHDYLYTKGVHRDFAWNTVPEATHRKTFFAEYSDMATVDGIVERARSVILDKEMDISKVQAREKPKEHTFVERKSPVVTIRNLERKPKLAIACVLKSGGCFGKDYVKILKNMLMRNLNIAHEFIAITDIPECDNNAVPLKCNYPGWWSKLELFNLKGPVDTI
jgi:hypothetical protein